MNTFLIRNGAILTMDAQNTMYTPGWVWVEGDRIAAVGPGQPPVELMARTGRLIDATHLAVLPGLVNGHTHLGQSFLRGFGSDLPQLDRLKQPLNRLSGAMTPGEMYLASLLGFLANLRSGVTAVVQHHTVNNSPQHIEATAQAAQAAGLRVCLAPGWADLGPGAEPAGEILDRMTWLAEQWHQADEGRLTLSLAPLATGRCSDGLLQQAVSLARRWGLATHMHLAATRRELELLAPQNVAELLERLHTLDLLGPDLHLVHALPGTETELDLIVASGATIIVCPVSEISQLTSMAAVVGQMLARGIPVGLGTGGSLWRHSPELLETLRLVTLLANNSQAEGPELRPREVLRMVTTTGAALLGRRDLGCLEPGAKADLTLINLNTVRAMPVHHPDSAVVYRATGPDVHTVMVDGRLLLEAGTVTVLDEAALLTECRDAAERLLGRVGMK